MRPLHINKLRIGFLSLMFLGFAYSPSVHALTDLEARQQLMMAYETIISLLMARIDALQTELAQLQEQQKVQPISTTPPHRHLL
ncbi:hypothetical protein A3E97_05150 [Candidatus Uhrbacteria bacterium RIFCSPHIGHO2_12_FULL_47_12]|nr:MAG: hypothetical protein A3E97_05150 [Candidatus Uhrbacteria bacterium RIFCSPHIGHO2_12_FULL_47_12]